MITALVFRSAQAVIFMVCFKATKGNTAVMEKQQSSLLSFRFMFLLFFYEACLAKPICETVCTCKNDTFRGTRLLADCSRIHLNIVPSVTDMPNNTYELNLSSNNISLVDVEMTHQCITVLRLNNNKIKVVKQSVFSGLKKLEHLDLSYNIIEDIADQTFYGLEGLLSLNLSHNKIKALDELTFAYLFSVQDLLLSNNKIVHLEKVHWNRMFDLRTLDLSNIGAYDFDANLFHGFDKLELLDLSQNDFNDVPTQALRSAKNLKWLRLNGNPIEKLGKNSFLKLNTLEELEVSFMPELEVVEARTFSGLASLRRLEVTMNQKLSSIDSEAFLGLFQNTTQPVLRFLNLEYNQISTLAKLPCNDIDKLNLQRNPWNCDCRLRWIKRCFISEIYAADLKCRNPESIRGKLIVGIAEDMFTCTVYQSDMLEEIHHNRVMRATSLAIGCLLLVVLAILIISALKWKSIRGWWRNRKSGPGAVYYVRARANPTEK